MKDADEVDHDSISSLKLSDKSPQVKNQDLPSVTFTPSSEETAQNGHIPTDEPEEAVQPSDPDPYLSVDMDNMKSRVGRRGSWAPITPPGSANAGQVSISPPEDDEESGSPLTRSPQHSRSSYSRPLTPPKEEQLRSKRPRTYNRRPSEFSQGRLSDQLLIRIFSLLDIYHIMRLRQVSLHWQRLLSFHPALARHLDLSAYNRHVTNKALTDYICPFVGNRPRTVDLSNCYHVTDAGFNALVAVCGQIGRASCRERVF